MSVEPGTKVWIPCDVRRSVFPDERLVRLESPTGAWDGIVDVRQLRDEIEEGRTSIAATVIESSAGRVSARLPGQTRRNTYLTGTLAQFERMLVP